MSYETGDSLLVRVRIAFGAAIADDPGTWTWTDVTAWWHAPADVTISWGRSDGAEQAETSKLALTLKNSDGRFTAWYPESPYWPHVVTWTPIQFDIDLGDGAGWRNRFSGFVRKWPVAWPGRSGRSAYARIEAVGVLGRLRRGKPPSRSPLQRAVTATSPVGYWPLEDGTDAIEAVSGLTGGAAGVVNLGVDFAAAPDTLPGSTPAVSANTPDSVLGALVVGAGNIRFPVPEHAVGAETLTFWVQATPVVQRPATNGVQVTVTNQIAFAGSGGLGYADVMLLSYDPTNSYSSVIGYWIQFYDTAGTFIDELYTGFAHDWDPFDGGWHEAQLRLSQSGSDISAAVYVDGVSGDTITMTARTLTPITAYTAGVNGYYQDSLNNYISPYRAPYSLAHVSVHNTAPGSFYEAGMGYDGEYAHDRLARVAVEEAVTATIPTVDAASSTPMGPQRAGTPVGIYQECEDADQGLLYESTFGLGYLPRASRYNTAVALTIDAAAGQLGTPFEPTADDQRLRNQWTVERHGGTEATAVDQDSIDAQGVIEASVQVRLADGSVLANHAGWRLHQSTAAEPRYPALSIDLGAHPALAADWCACIPGSRVQVLSPPPQAPPGTVDQIIVGATETYRGRRHWRATLNVSPAAPWTVGVWLDDVTTPGPADPSRYDTDGSELAAAYVAGTDTSISVATASGPLWTTDSGAYPADLAIGGVRVRATACSGTSSPQTITVQAATINGVTKTVPAGTAVSLWQPAIYAL